MKLKEIGLIGLISLIALQGCASNDMSDDGVPAGDKQAASRLDEIAKTSGGDWNKLSQSDKDYLVKEVAHGSEQTAKMLLQSKSGHLDGGAGGAGK